MSATLTPIRKRRPAQSRQERINSIRGKYVHVRTSSSTFARTKRSEITREASQK